MIYLNIYNFNISICSNDVEIEKRLKFDFNYFLSKKISEAHLTVEVFFQDFISPNLIPENLKPIYQRKNSITYEKSPIRFNDYYGKVLTLFNFQTNVITAYGVNLDKLYEVVYLIVLSRSGKALDLSGLHKIHAFSISKNGQAIICMQPMRGGKSTLLTELLLHQEVEINSDDTPLINSNGTLLPFPLHLSLDTLPPSLKLNEDQFFIMNREFYQNKFSISVEAFHRPISQPTMKYKLIEAHRSTYATPQIIKMSKFRLLTRLIKHMVIGFGLPIIFEYFWESGKSDFFIRLKILFKRLRLAIKISLKNEAYDLYLTSNNRENAKAIMSILNS